jgi:hypothetical protein
MGGGEVYQKNMASPMLGCTDSRRKKKTAGRAILGEMRASVWMSGGGEGRGGEWVMLVMSGGGGRLARVGYSARRQEYK